MKLAALLALAVLTVSVPAHAIPAFARRYQVSCQTCHATAFPELNPFGRRFKENGYQFPRGSEESYAALHSDRPFGAPLEILREAPISIRGQVAAVIQPVANAVPPRTQNSLFLPTRFDLLGGGALYPDVAVFASLGLLPTPFVYALTVGVFNVGAPGLLNIQAGRFLLTDFQRPAHRGLTRGTEIAETVRVGGNPFFLDDHHTGLRIFGRPKEGRFFYEGAVVQGTMDATTGFDLDNWKDFWGRVSADIADHRVGVFGHLGNSNIPSIAGGITRNFQDPTSHVGVDAELLLPGVTVFGYGLRGHHANPFALGRQAVTFFSGRLEADVPLWSRFEGVARFDLVRSSDDPTLERQLATAFATFLLTQNVRASAQASFTVKGSGGDVFSLFLDAAF